MPFNLMPFLGSKVEFKSDSGNITGILIGITTSLFIVQIEDGSVRKFPYSALKSAYVNFGTFNDALKHLADSGELKHCDLCYIAFLYAIDFLGRAFPSQVFQSRSDLIRRGIVSYLAEDYPTAAYSLLPQADGIITHILHEDGLLRKVDGFPIWTKEHPDESLHGKPCRNMIEALKGSKKAKSMTRIGHALEWLKEDKIETIRKLRNKLLHGTLLEVSEHEASMVILLLQALSHGLLESVSIANDS
jgi:hypothetical protein